MLSNQRSKITKILILDMDQIFYCFMAEIASRKGISDCCMSTISHSTEIITDTSFSIFAIV